MFNSPKKEVIIAIIVGLTTGIFFSYLLFFFRARPQVFKQKKREGVKVLISPSPSPKKEKPKEISHLIIDSPLNESIVSEEKVEVSGKAPKNSLIIIVAETQEKVVKEKDGHFKSEISLIPGENQINITAIFADGNDENSIMTIIYQET